MKKISLVERQKKNPQRYNIYLDGEFAFGADEDTVVKFRLLKGKEIEEADLEKILFETEIGKLMERMYGLFTRRQRTEKEVRDYLRNLSFKRTLKDQEALSPVVIDKVIERLYEKRLLDDRLFAQQWVRARQLSKKKGQIAIKQELMQKGVTKEIVEEVLQEQTNPDNEYALAQAALTKKERLFKGLEEMEYKQKALQFLIRRGFAYETAKDVVEDFVKRVYT